jgi:plasmid stabilization system protein ParE
MFDTFAAIGAFPKASRERDEAANGMRLKNYRIHLILFRLDETGPLIVRVVHGSYDWQSDY